MKLTAQQLGEVALAVNNVHNLNAGSLDAVEENILVHGKAAVSGAEILAGPASQRISTQHLGSGERNDRSPGRQKIRCLQLYRSRFIDPDLKHCQPGLTAETIRHPFASEARSARASSFSFTANSGRSASE